MTQGNIRVVTGTQEKNILITWYYTKTDVTVLERFSIQTKMKWITRGSPLAKETYVRIITSKCYSKMLRKTNRLLSKTKQIANNQALQQQ